MQRITAIISHLSLFLCLFAACKGEQIIAIPEQCLQTQEFDHWETELFNNYYTIQFPRGYRGGREDQRFTKERKDDKVIITYNFCTPDGCADFGDTLPSYNPGEIALSTGNTAPIMMNKAVFYCCGNDTCGVYFLRDSSTFVGKYYQRTDQLYRHAATVTCSRGAFYEVLQILGTIRKK